MVTKIIKVRPLCIILPNTSAYERNFDETEYMSLLIKMMNFQKNVIKSMMIDKSTNILKAIKYQMNVLIAFVHQ